MSRKQKPREAQGLSVAAPMMILKRPDKPTQLPQSASQSTPPPAQTFSNAPSHTPIQNYPTSPSRPKAEPRSYSRVVPTEAQTPPLKIVKPRTKSISEATPKPQPESNPATTQYQIGRRNGVNRAETVTPFFRLIDKTMNIEKGLQIESLSNEPDSLSVVVVLGTKSSGKSLIASHLFQSTSPFTDLQNQDHPKHVANDRFTNIFFREPLESVFSNTAQDKTEGVNVSINDHGVIVLDTQPVLTGVSLLENRSKSKEKDSDLISPTEEDSYLKSLHTSLFAASVSDVIVVVSDRVPNENLFQLLEATESVRQSPGPWGGEGSQTPLPRVVFVVNRVPLSMFVLGKTEKMKNQIYMRMRNSGFCRYSNDVEVHFIPEIKPGQEWVSVTGGTSFATSLQSLCASVTNHRSRALWVLPLSAVADTQSHHNNHNHSTFSPHRHSPTPFHTTHSSHAKGSDRFPDIMVPTRRIMSLQEWTTYATWMWKSVMKSERVVAFQQNLVT